MNPDAPSPSEAEQMVGMLMFGAIVLAFFLIPFVRWLRTDSEPDQKYGSFVDELHCATFLIKRIRVFEGGIVVPRAAAIIPTGMPFGTLRIPKGAILGIRHNHDYTQGNITEFHAFQVEFSCPNAPSGKCSLFFVSTEHRRAAEALSSLAEVKRVDDVGIAGLQDAQEKELFYLEQDARRAARTARG